MIIHNAGRLGVDYFVSYFRLVLGTRTSDVEEAKAIVLERIFKNDPTRLGDESYRHFLQAYATIQQENDVSLTEVSSQEK